jgi:signal transduction histidine kinase
MYPVHDTTGQVTRIAVFSRDITERKKTEAQIKSLSQQLLQAHEDERQMIGRELHDSAAQDLSTLKIALGTFFGKSSAASEEDRRKFANLSKLIDRSIVTIRNMSYELHPPELKEIGLIQTLATYCEEFSVTSGIDVDFHASGLTGTELDFFIQINLYRLVQEALNNIRKHAEARQASIRLVGAHPNVILHIEDDGRGFDVEARERALDDEKRLGLRSMKERVTLLQGKMTIRSRVRQGTRIHIKFPNRKE